MKIRLNGDERILAEEVNSVSKLLTDLGFKSKPVVVEYNQAALLPSKYEGTVLEEDDQVEVIIVAAGG